MSWWEDLIPPPEEVRAMFPFDVFAAAHAKLMDVFWLNLPEDQHSELLQRGSKAEEAIEELMVVWRRIGEDRIADIEAFRRRHEMEDDQGLGHYTLGTGEHPDIDEVWRAGLEAETQLRVDYKSLFVFGEIAFRDYLVLSEVVWDAPSGIEHDQGPTRFLLSLKKRTADQPLDPDARFGRLVLPLLPLMTSVDNSLGFYRDKFLIHVPADMILSGAGGAVGAPLPFHMDYARRREIEQAQLARLAETVKRVETTEGLSLPSGEEPWTKLRKLSNLLDRLDDPETLKAVKDTLLEWGAELPPAQAIARALAKLFESWADVLIAEYGLMQA